MFTKYCDVTEVYVHNYITATATCAIFLCHSQKLCLGHYCTVYVDHQPYYDQGDPEGNKEETRLISVTLITRVTCTLHLQGSSHSSVCQYA